MFLLFDIYEKLEIDSDINNIIDKLSSYSMSDELYIYIILETSKNNIPPFSNIISKFEMKEKFFSLKIFFPLLEELKNIKIEKRFEQLAKKDEKYFKILYSYYISDKSESINELKKSEKAKKIIDEIIIFTEKNLSHILMLIYVYSFVFVFLFKDINIEENQNDKNEDLALLYKFYESIDSGPQEEEIKFIINYLIQMKSLNHTKDILQITLLVLNLVKNKKEIEMKEKIDENCFKKFGETFINNISEKLLWIIYEGEDSDKKYKETILEGKKTLEEKLSFNVFEELNKSN